MSYGVQTLVIVGVGLMGASFAMALKRARLVARVVGVDHSEQVLTEALARGVIDCGCQDVRQAVNGADMVVLATPVGQLAAILQAVRPALNPSTIISDLSSTKANVAALLRQYLPGHLSYCLPTHPMAGSERSGVAAAQDNLFQRRSVVLTPLPETHDVVKAQVSALWSGLGAKIYIMDAEAHDNVLATVSHLPHVLAFAYVNEVITKPHAQSGLKLASSGFRDFTRIAASSPEMWRDITLANRVAVLRELTEYQQKLTRLSEMIASEDADSMLRLFSGARKARLTWGKDFFEG